MHSLFGSRDRVGWGEGEVITPCIGYIAIVSLSAVAPTEMDEVTV